MFEYGFKGSIRIDGREVDSADMWQEDVALQEGIESLVENSSSPESIVQVGVTTKQGAEDLMAQIAPEVSDDEHEKRTDELIAGIRAQGGKDNQWFFEKYGVVFDFEVYKVKLRQRGVKID